MNAQEISRTGLDVEWRRLEIIAQNLANAGTTLDADGNGYRPLQLLSGPARSFADLSRSGAPAEVLAGVRVYSIEPQNIAPRRVYQPGHPQADDKGFVMVSGVDHAGEMVRMLTASRAYEANIAALNAARQMYAHALKIGRNA
ncbi:MAG: flagellar basal body rod protein FlgC [Proteobacteria bacterium]|nr:flagellar basal body rod protein FlgC [Pseudomonadota bacterium]